MRKGDELFRKERSSQAKTSYEAIIRTNLTVPTTSPLYQGTAMATMKKPAQEAVKRIKGLAHQRVNSRVVEAIMRAHGQLEKIDANLNYLGFADDHVPIFRFRYLQSVARYMADNAIQAERTFINFRTAAENQKMERIHIENEVEVQEAAVRVEEKQLESADLEVQYATQSRQYAQQRKAHADDALTEWNTTGRELTSVNAALAWASNAANDQKINYTGVQYHGETHNYSGDVEDFYDTVGEVREWINWELQRNKLARQAAELATEVALTQTREAQAQVRREVQRRSLELARIRAEGAREVLDYSGERMFDEDLWFRLAGELRDVARDYLDMAIYAAFLMERAYDLEFDRDLNVIRLDYGLGGVSGLLGGDYLKRDVEFFTHDYLQNAQKKNPVRLLLSLREEYPSAFNGFVSQGIMPFRTDLEIFDRRYPGTLSRKIKKIEIFVEGLVPAEGAHGYLTHQGISSEWRLQPAGWQKHTRVMPPERMVLSSYQFRRDISVFQPSEEMLGQFENLGPEGNWTLELPKSGNNLDYDAITDVKFVVYFDADFDESLRTHVNAFHPATGGRSLVLSSRFHYPDEYYRLEPERSVAFELSPRRFQYNYTNLAIAGFGVRVIGLDGNGLAGVGLTITRDSDSSSVTTTTDADGLRLGHASTMAPFAAWKNASPADTFSVAFADGFDLSTVGDVQLFMDYSFTYRLDGTVVV